MSTDAKRAQKETVVNGVPQKTSMMPACPRHAAGMVHYHPQGMCTEQQARRHSCYHVSVRVRVRVWLRPTLTPSKCPRPLPSPPPPPALGTLPPSFTETRDVPELGLGRPVN